MGEVGGHDLPALGVIRGQFPGIRAAAVFQQASLAVSRQRRRSEHFGEASFRAAPPHFHLPQAVLRHHEALREEQVFGRLRVDVRDAPAIPDDFDRRFQSRHHRSAVDLREPLFCESRERVGCGLLVETVADREKECEGEKRAPEHAQSLTQATRFGQRRE